MSETDIIEGPDGEKGAVLFLDPPDLAKLGIEGETVEYRVEGGKLVVE